MKEPISNAGSMDSFEYKRMTVRRMTAYMYTSLYLSFGWTLEHTSVPVSKPVNISLCFKRQRETAVSVSARKLQREFDAAIGEIEAQERVQEACTRLAVLFGLFGVLLLAAAMALSKLFLISGAVQITLVVLGLVICGAAFFFYCAIYKRRADEFAADLCAKYSEIYRIGTQAAAIISQS